LFLINDIPEFPEGALSLAREGISKLGLAPHTDLCLAEDQGALIERSRRSLRDASQYILFTCLIRD
jgi:hypothetical protein